MSEPEIIEPFPDEPRANFAADIANLYKLMVLRFGIPYEFLYPPDPNDCFPVRMTRYGR